MKFSGKLAVGIVVSGLAVAAHAREFNYSYFELVADASDTDNTHEFAVEDAEGTLFGFRGSFEIFDSWYVEVGYSREKKEGFVTECDVGGIERRCLERDSPERGIPIKLVLDSDQTFLEFGIGYHLKIAEQTDLYAEVFALDTEVEHDILDGEALGGLFSPGPPPGVGGEQTAGPLAPMMGRLQPPRRY